jgi:hypothetical protein
MGCCETRSGQSWLRWNDCAGSVMSTIKVRDCLIVSTVGEVTSRLAFVRSAGAGLDIPGFELVSFTRLGRPFLARLVPQLGD